MQVNYQQLCRCMFNWGNRVEEFRNHAQFKIDKVKADKYCQ